MLTFSLIITLLYPSDGYVQRFEVGANLPRAVCEMAAARAYVQLRSTLSEAELIGVSCEPTREV